MRLTRTLLVVAVALFAAVGVFYAWQQGRALSAARDTALALGKERNDLRKQLWDAQRRRAELEAQLRQRTGSAEDGSLAAAPAGPDEAAPDGPMRPPGDGTGFGRLMELMDNPEVQRLASIQQRGALDARFADLFRRLNLSPQQLEQFKNLLLEKRAAVADVMAAARTEGLNGRENRDEVRALIQAAQAEVDATIRSTIGETAYAQYENFEQTQSQRATVDRLEQRLSYSGTPLTDAQSEQLVQLLAANAAENQGGNRLPGNVRGQASRFGLGGAQGGAPISDAAVAQAATVLAPAQVQALQQLQQEQQAQTQLGQIVREQMRNRRPGNPATPTTPAPGAPPKG